VSDSASVWPADAVEVGRIAGAWGLKGWIKVQPFAAEPQALFASRRWFLQPAPTPIVRPAGLPAGALPSVLDISSVREHGDGVVAQATQLPDRNLAEALRGARVFVSRASFPAPEADEFYWIDLIGLTVLDRQGQTLGEVVGLLETGPHCVLRLRVPGAAADAPLDEAERLIPFVDAYVDKVDLPARTIHVDWSADY
jgi:16S rRNA processing protein RimM